MMESSIEKKKKENLSIGSSQKSSENSTVSSVKIPLSVNSTVSSAKSPVSSVKIPLSSLKSAEKDENSSFSLQNGTESISNFLDIRKNMLLPPPAGFGSFTRPSTLLAKLIKGPVSLDESSLSPATQRRLFIHRNTQSSHQIDKNEENLSNKVKEEKREALGKGEYWSDFPSSPLSPPSPFQHPFFQRQLGLLPPESWSRFSWFGQPHLNPTSQPNVSSHSKNDEQSVKQDEKKKNFHSKNQYHSSTTKTVLSYCQESQSYKVARETRFSPTYSDGVSETESEDDDEEAYSNSNRHRYYELNNGGSDINAGTSSSEDILPASSTSASISNSSNPSVSHSSSPKLRPNFISLNDVHSKCNSQTKGSEADIDDTSSLTISEPDSFQDVQSRNSHYSQDSYGDRISSFCESNSEQKLSPIKDHSETSKIEKVHKIALELLHSERSYVSVLHLIDQEFQFRVDQQNRVHHLFPPDQMPLMFSNIKSIYKLHHDFLLPQLEERMSQWDNFKRIGDIMKNFAPFLKMYTEYVKNFDNAMTLITMWQNKSARFATIMDEIHNLKVCGNLTLTHHMLSPVQRIPRYEMLLKDYLRKLPENSPDRKDTEEALHLVSTAANHANDAMKKIDKFKKLLEVQESLGGATELVSPTRELLKEGRIIKISARSGDHQERYLFLFSDLLLLCTSRLMGGRVISGPQYRLRARYKVENLEVLEGDNLETANTFYIRDTNKTVELYTQTKEEKDSWLSMLFLAIHESVQRKSSLRLSNLTDLRESNMDLGLKQPVLIPSDSVNKCMHCGSQFSIVKRKHHCRACGQVVCNRCSNYKVNLPCESGKSVRVCKACHDVIVSMGTDVVSQPIIDQDEKTPLEESLATEDGSGISAKYDSLVFKTRGILEVSANASEAITKGYLQLKTHRKSWVKRWFALHSDFVLYSFKTDEDKHALTAMPLPGFTVSYLQNTKGESGVNEKDKEKVFKIHHTKKQYIFLTSSTEEAVRWVTALQKASQAELPSPVQ